MSSQYDQNRPIRDRYKEWFKDNLNLLSIVCDYWCEDNKESVQDFVNKFLDTYNWIAAKNFIPRIQRES